MKALVADTHSAIWYVADSPELSSAAVTAMDDATDAGKPIYVSAITLIEMTYLIEKGRLPERDLTDLLNELKNPLSNFELVAIDLAVTQSLRLISRADVPDMPDRIIAATARHLNLPLVTRDHKIRAAKLLTIW
ncbi:MAG: type II toxin-antitoxin system VapC family toxin [Pyrinomonadaceae bacterium]|nr:type II toxin-antitoxin system VapC family toxin [Pyrinomonadaceae bacterium]